MAPVLVSVKHSRRAVRAGEDIVAAGTAQVGDLRLDILVGQQQLVAHAGNPAAADQFPFFALCGTMSQSLETDRIGEDHLHFVVYRG